MKKYKRILILYTAFMGDIILSTALIREIRLLFPDAVIDYLTIPANYDLLKNNPHLNKIIIFDKHNKKLINFFKIIPKLIKNKYEIALSPHSHFTTNFLMLFSLIPQRVGYNRYRSRFLLNKKVEYPKSGHVSERILTLLSVFSNKKFDCETELFLSNADEIAAEQILLEYENPILIAPGSVWNTKRWNKKYFAQLANMLENKSFKLVFIGSKADRALAKDIIESQDLAAYNACGELSITESAALIKHAKLLISNDSAPLHIANALNTPVYTFFGPTVKDFGYYPYRENDKVIEIELECRPCGMHGSNKCPLTHHNCMNLIKPEYVLELVAKNFQA